MTTEIDDLVEPTPEAAKLNRFDVRSLWRVAFWGSSAALAVVVVAGTALSDVGTQRFKVAVAAALDHFRPAQPAPAEPAAALVRAAEIEKQTQELGRQTQEFRRQTQELNAQAQQLRETVKQLSADRDQLKTRISLLEQNLEDITGTIKRQAQQPAKEPAVTATQSQAPPPAVSAPPTATASIAEPQPRASTVAPAPEQAAVPTPPMRTAALPAAPQPTERREFGVDLGGAASLEHLRIAWATIKANAGPDLTGMRPAYSQRQRPNGAIEYRLVVVGSFQDTAEAAAVCQKLTAVKLNCRPGQYRVSQLAER